MAINDMWGDGQASFITYPSSLASGTITAPPSPLPHDFGHVQTINVASQGQYVHVCPDQTKALNDLTKAMLDLAKLPQELLGFVAHLSKHYDADTVKVLADYLEELGNQHHARVRELAKERAP